MRIRRTWLLVGLLLLMAVAAGALAWHRVPQLHAHAEPAAAERHAPPSADTIELSQHVVEAGGIKTVLASEPTRPRRLELRGSLMYDPARLVHVHSRFPGTIQEIGMIDDPAVDSPGVTPHKRPLRYTDHVKAGQRLAVLWSKDLGEKKSELVDAVAKLKLHEQNYKRLKEYSEAISERALRDAATAVDLDMIAVSRAERTLRSWALTSNEIAKVKAEADAIHKRQTEEVQQDAEWARAEIVSPTKGTILEQNATVGDNITDTSYDLFKIADLSVMSVLLRAYEEDLHYLERMPLPIPVEIRLPANPELGTITASIDRIGDSIDAYEHMALLFGSVPNPDDKLKIGQFVTGSIDIGAETNVVEIPSTALVDDGNDSYIFVQPNPDAPRFVCRKVLDVRRHKDVVYLRRHLTDEERARGLHGVEVGERVVSRGALEMKEALSQQNATNGSP